MKDWDFYGGAEDVEWMRSYLKERCGSYEEASDRLGGTHFLDGRDLAISFLAWDAVADAILATPDCFEASAFGRPATAIGPYTQLALKLGYLRCVGYHGRKNSDDVSYWLENLEPSGWTPEHDTLFSTMWTRAERIFNIPKTSLQTSNEWRELNRWTSLLSHDIEPKSQLTSMEPNVQHHP